MEQALEVQVIYLSWLLPDRSSWVSFLGPPFVLILGWCSYLAYPMEASRSSPALTHWPVMSSRGHEVTAWMPVGRCWVCQLKAIHPEFSANGPAAAPPSAGWCSPAVPPHYLDGDSSQLLFPCPQLVPRAAISFCHWFALLSWMECVWLIVYWCFCFAKTEPLTLAADVLPPWFNTFCELLGQRSHSGGKQQSFPDFWQSGVPIFCVVPGRFLFWSHGCKPHRSTPLLELFQPLPCI